MMTVAAPQNDPRLLAPTKVKVLRPFCVEGQRREVGDVVELAVPRRGRGGVRGQGEDHQIKTAADIPRWVAAESFRPT